MATSRTSRRARIVVASPPRGGCEPERARDPAEAGQRGASLVLVLIFLFLLSVLATSILFLTDVELRLSKNNEDTLAVLNDLDNAAAEVLWRLNLEPGPEPPPTGSTVTVNRLVDYDAALDFDPAHRLTDGVDQDLDGLIDDPDELVYNRDWVARILLTEEKPDVGAPWVLVDTAPSAAPWGGRQVEATIQPVSGWHEYTSDRLTVENQDEVLTIRFKLDTDTPVGDSEGDGPEIVYYDWELVRNHHDDINTLSGLGGDGDPDHDSPYNITWSNGVTTWPASGAPVVLIETLARQRLAGRVVAERRLRAEAAYPVRATMGKAICGCAWVDMGSSNLTDSYSSSEGRYGTGPIYRNGDVGSNGYLIADGQVLGNLEAGDYITGASAATGDATAGGTIEGTPGGDFYPGWVPRPEPCPCDGLDPGSLVAEARLHNDNATLPPRCRGPAIRLSGSDVCTLDCGTYYYDVVDLKGSSTILVGDTSCGPVKLFVSGVMDIAGNGIVNTARPEELQIVSSLSGPELDLGGTSDFVGVVFAPLADILLRGTNDFQGAVLGRTVDGNGGPDVHYDEDLGRLWLVPGSFRLISWLELP